MLNVSIFDDKKQPNKLICRYLNIPISFCRKFNPPPRHQPLILTICI